jgi:hypothetical protein
MDSSNKNDANKADVLQKLEILRGALGAQPDSATRASALDQCERLRLSIAQFHAEGLRFAAYTLLRLTLPPAASSAPVQTAAAQLKAALDAAGYPH